MAEGMADRVVEGGGAAVALRSKWLGVRVGGMLELSWLLASSGVPAAGEQRGGGGTDVDAVPIASWLAMVVLMLKGVC
jgi:hypothetical protein